MLPEISLASLAVAAAANFLFGGLWYGIFGKAWMKELNLTPETIKTERWPMPAMAFAVVASIAHALALAIVLGWAEPPHVGAALAIGAGLGVVAALATGKHEAFSRQTWRLFAIDGGSDVVGFVAMALVFGLWPAGA